MDDHLHHDDGDGEERAALLVAVVVVVLVLQLLMVMLVQMVLMMDFRQNHCLHMLPRLFILSCDSPDARKQHHPLP